MMASTSLPLSTNGSKHGNAVIPKKAESTAIRINAYKPRRKTRRLANISHSIIEIQPEYCFVSSSSRRNYDNQCGFHSRKRLKHRSFVVDDCNRRCKIVEAHPLHDMLLEAIQNEEEKRLSLPSDDMSSSCSSLDDADQTLRSSTCSEKSDFSGYFQRLSC